MQKASPHKIAADTLVVSDERQTIINKRSTSKQLIYALIAYSSCLAPSMSIGFSAVAIPAIMKDPLYPFDTAQASWFASVASIATPLGCLFSGPTSDRLGRKAVLLMVNLIAFVGWITIAVGMDLTRHRYAVLIVGRLLTGFSTGFASMPPVVYMSEVATAQLRGTFTTANGVFFALGIVVVYVFGALFPDSCGTVAVLSAILPCISMVLVVFLLPETPQWLVSQNRIDEASNNMLRIYGHKEYTKQIYDDIQQLIKHRDATRAQNERSNRHRPSNHNNANNHNTNNANRNNHKYVNDNYANDNTYTNDNNYANDNAEEEERADDTKWTAIVRWLRPFGRKTCYKPFLILQTYFFFQQFSGTFVVAFYAISIVEEAGVTLDHYAAIVLIAFTRFVAALIVSYVSRTAGRRPMSLASGCGMTVCMCVVAAYLYFDVRTQHWLPLACLMLYFFTSTLGFLTMPFAMSAECFPQEIKGTVTGFLTCMAYAFNFITVKFYPDVLRAFGSHGTFLIFGIISFTGTVFIYFFLPETKGKTLIEIQEFFKGSDNKGSDSPSGNREDCHLEQA